MTQDAESGESAPAESAADGQLVEVSYTTSAVVLDPIERVLKGLEAKHKNVVYDMTTTKGDKEARAARLELVRTRTGAKKAYQEWNAPIKAEQEKARARVADITARVEAIENPLDALIKADEARREAERIERERIEAERVAAIRKRIDNINGLPMAAIDMGSDDIAAVIEDLSLVEINEARFAEFQDEARSAVAAASEKLESMRVTAAQREAAAEQLRLQQEQIEQQRLELEKQRAELARQQAEQDERTRIDNILREEQARAAADKEARDAEDARRAAAGQTDAFPNEKREAIDAVADLPKLNRTSAPHGSTSAQRYVAPRVAQAAPPAPAPAPQAPVEETSIEDVNAAAIYAAAEDRSEVPFYDNEPSAPSTPSAAWVVDAVAQAWDVDAETALQWLRDIDFGSVTLEEVTDGQ